jgi:hypothetical protein
MLAPQVRPKFSKRAGIVVESGDRGQRESALGCPPGETTVEWWKWSETGRQTPGTPEQQFMPSGE